MIEEQFVSFDTARLLKEAGFDVPCEHFYTDDDYGEMERRKLTHPVNHNAYTDDYSCPTQSLVSRWLRDAHKIHVFACIEYPTGKWFYCNPTGKWFYCIADTTAPSAREGMNMPEANHDTHEGAMEAGIQEAIKLIKQQDHEEDIVQ